MSVPVLLSSAVLVVLVTCGCQAPASSASVGLSERVAVLEQKVKDLESKGQANAVEQDTEKPSSDTPTPPETNEQTTSSDGAAKSNQEERLVDTVDFSEFPSPQRLKELVSFNFLAAAQIHSPSDLESEITRGQYVAMLVEMNNYIFEAKSGKSIRLARGDDQTFTDVPSTHRYYKYIQGVVDAGYVIGFDEKTFKPDKILTREEMLAIAAKRDYNFKADNANYRWRRTVKWTDKEEVAPKYRHSLAYDMSRGPRSNFNQAFGEAKLLKPKQPVRAFEAVLSIYKVGNHGDYIYKKKVKEALGEG